MQITIRAYEEKDLSEMIRIWNEVVEDGVAFPQEELLTAETGKDFFAQQTYSAVAQDTETGTIYGFCSSMRLSHLMYMQDICMNGLVLSSLELFQRDFE